jgi:hypothetical protein
MRANPGWLTFAQQLPAAWDAAHLHLQVDRGIQHQHWGVLAQLLLILRLMHWRIHAASPVVALHEVTAEVPASQ